MEVLVTIYPSKYLYTSRNVEVCLLFLSITYIETSAATGKNVEKAVNALLDMVMRRMREYVCTMDAEQQQAAPPEVKKSAAAAGGGGQTANVDVSSPPPAEEEKKSSSCPCWRVGLHSCFLNEVQYFRCQMKSHKTVREIWKSYSHCRCLWKALANAIKSRGKITLDFKPLMFEETCVVDLQKIKPNHWRQESLETTINICGKLSQQTFAICTCIYILTAILRNDVIYIPFSIYRVSIKSLYN